MEAQLQTSIETIANLLYLVRLSCPGDMVATNVYLDLAEGQIQLLADRLEKVQSEP